MHTWLTTFHLASVVLDPYTNESSWVLKTAIRILGDLRGSHAHVNFIVTADEADTKRFLGPIADDFLVFCDPDRSIVKAMGLRAPAHVCTFIRVDGEVVAKAEGWSSAAWREVAEGDRTTKWRAPMIPAPANRPVRRFPGQRLTWRAAAHHRSPTCRSSRRSRSCRRALRRASRRGRRSSGSRQDHGRAAADAGRAVARKTDGS